MTTELIMWIAGASAVVLRFLSKRGGYRYPLSVLCILILWAGVAVLSHHLRGGYLIPYPMALLPLSMQVLALILLLFFLNDALDLKNVEELLAGSSFAVGFGVVALCYVAGTFLGYHWVQAAGGIVMLLCVLSHILVQRQSSYHLFCAATIACVLMFSLLVILSARYYYGGITLQSLRNSVLFHSASVLFLLCMMGLNLKRHGVFAEKKLKTIAKIALALTIASFVLRHPELDAKCAPMIKDVLKYAACGGDIGALGYCSIAVVKAAIAIT